MGQKGPVCKHIIVLMELLLNARPPDLHGLKNNPNSDVHASPGKKKPEKKKSNFTVKNKQTGMADYKKKTPPSTSGHG